MKYVELCGNNVSRLGLGCMRLPEKDGKIDYDKAMEMAEFAINNGINYFDTAYVYHNQQSEYFVGEVVKKFGRDKIFIASKLPIYYCKEESDLQKYLDEQLEKVGIDYFDYYLFHALDVDNFNLMKKFNYKEFIKRNMENGKIKHIGFSFHDEFNVFKEIIDDYDWEFCQIQFNYLDTDYQAGLKGYNYALEKSIPMIIMEPLRGGKLINIPSNVKDVFNKKYSGKSDAEIAFRFVGNYANNKLILSGMRNMNDLKENVMLFDNELDNQLSNEDMALYSEAKVVYNGLSLINCTGCRYCEKGCPHQIPIPDIFAKYNQVLTNSISKDEAKEWYNSLNSNAKKCISCGSCERICPQGLEIIENLKLVDEYFN